MDSSASKRSKPHRCTVKDCKASFSRPWKLEAHERKHTGERPFVCDFQGCSKSYTNKSHLKRHKTVSHEGLVKSEELVCEFEGCGQVLSNRYALKKHHSRNHCTDVLQYKCAVCLEGFKRKEQLREHLCSHYGKSVFQCAICSKGFMKFHLYSKHLRRHKTYECDCGLVFERWSQICEHRRTSCKIKKVQKCIICKKVFPSGTNLKEHSLNKHVEESHKDVFHCPYLDCKRNYTLRRNLNSHIRAVHENRVPKESSNPFKCPEPNCKVALKSQRILNQHIRVVHKKLLAKERKRKLLMSELTGLNENPLKVVKDNPLNCIDATSLSLSTEENLPEFRKPENKREFTDVIEKYEAQSETLSKEPSISDALDTFVQSEKSRSNNQTCNLGNYHDTPNESVLICDSDLLKQCDDILNVLNEHLTSNPMDELSY